MYVVSLCANTQQVGYAAAFRSHCASFFMCFMHIPQCSCFRFCFLSNHLSLRPQLKNLDKEVVDIFNMLFANH